MPSLLGKNSDFITLIFPIKIADFDGVLEVWKLAPHKLKIWPVLTKTGSKKGPKSDKSEMSIKIQYMACFD